MQQWRATPRRSQTNRAARPRCSACARPTRSSGACTVRAWWSSVHSLLKEHTLNLEGWPAIATCCQALLVMLGLFCSLLRGNLPLGRRPLERAPAMVEALLLIHKEGDSCLSILQCRWWSASQRSPRPLWSWCRARRRQGPLHHCAAGDASMLSAECGSCGQCCQLFLTACTLLLCPWHGVSRKHETCHHPPAVAPLRASRQTNQCFPFAAIAGGQVAADPVPDQALHAAVAERGPRPDHGRVGQVAPPHLCGVPPGKLAAPLC